MKNITIYVVIKTYDQLDQTQESQKSTFGQARPNKLLNQRTKDNYKQYLDHMITKLTNFTWIVERYKNLILGKFKVNLKKNELKSNMPHK